MECLDVQSRIDAWLDGALEADAAARVAVHVDACPTCRARVEARRALDLRLRRALRPLDEASRRAADRALDAWRAETASAAAPRPTTSWRRLALAAAAGFCLALLLFPPTRRDAVPGPDRAAADGARPDRAGPADSPGTESPPVAELVVSTGPVETRAPGRAVWTAIAEPAAFHCPSGGEVRTGEGVRCELRTSDGGVVRLDEQAEIAFRAADEVELRKGTAWCRAADGAPLRLVAAAPAVPGAASAAWSCAAPSRAVVLTEVRSDGALRIRAANDSIELAARDERRTIRPGESVELADGRIALDPRYEDALLATSWMHDLLVRRGHHDEELAQRVDRLLASLGRSKIASLYEDEIRSLGDFGALPLLKFLQSPESRSEPAARGTALRVLADVAPAWLIPELIEMLGDVDPLARRGAADALLRLTRLDHGRPPEAWTEPLDACLETRETWRAWWREHRHRYPRPPLPPGTSHKG